MIADEKLTELLAIARNNHERKPACAVIEQDILTCGELGELVLEVKAQRSALLHASPAGTERMRALLDEQTTLIESHNVSMRIALNQRDEARALARVLAHAYQRDARPPAEVVRDALAFPIFPERKA